MSRIAIHPPQELLLDYIADQISDGGRLRVDEHLAECQPCARDVRALHRLRDQFEQTWTRWSADEHQRIYEQMNLLRAAELADETPDPRLKAWLKSLSTGAKIGVKLLLDRGKQIAGIAAGALPGSYEYEHRPRVAGVGSPGAEALLDSRISTAARLLKEDRVEAAMQEMMEASLINSYATQSVNSIIYRLGKKYAEIVADGRRASLMVKYWPHETGINAEFVLLLPKDGGQKPRYAPLRAVAGEEYAVAIFDDVGDGASDVIIGPDA
jgi:anti-sigma factor RsiW